MHSHLIPGIDDGAPTIEESTNLIKALCEFGYTRLITTPHIMSDFFKNTPENIMKGLEQLKKIVKETGIPVEIEAAAEYYVDFEFISLLNQNKLLTLGDNYVLIELSLYNPPSNLKEIIFELQTANYKVILAHPERYSYWYPEMDNFRDLHERGVYFQLNIGSLTGSYGGVTRKIAEKMIHYNMISFLGTDTHGKRHIQMIKELLRNKLLKQLIESGVLLNNTL